MYFLIRINFKAIGAQEKEPAPGVTPWELYARCEMDNADTCQLFRQIAALSPKDRKAAMSALHKFIHVAASGQPLTCFYDKKQCHEIHSFKYGGKERIVWRIWKGDVVRITFYYCEGRAIFLTNVFTKYEDKLTNAQKLMLEKEVRAYIDAEHKKEIHTFEKEDD